MRSTGVKGAGKDSIQRDEHAGASAQGTASGYSPDGGSKLIGDKVTAMHVLLLNLGTESTQEVQQALLGQGYKITTDRNLTVDEVLALSPGVLVTEATPSDLSCCGLISQIKAGPDQPTLKIVMIVHGGALERARALDLRADDVISFPFDRLEFAARIRAQFRERQPELELEAKLKDALEKEHLAETAVEALSGGLGAKRRFGLIPAIFVLSAAVILAALAMLISNRHGRRVTLQLKAEVARLFARRKGKDGSPRVTAALRDAGWRVSENTVAGLMREQGLAARPGRKGRKGTTRPGKGRWRAPDLVGRKFAAAGINRRWYGDGTEIPTGEGKLHLDSVLDVGSRRILGFALGEHHDADLAYGALAMAVAVRRGAVPGVVFHSDQVRRVHRPDLPAGLRAAGHLPVHGTARLRAG